MQYRGGAASSKNRLPSLALKCATGCAIGCAIGCGSAKTDGADSTEPVSSEVAGCAFPALSCNDVCLDPGEAAGGCSHLIRFGVLRSVTVHEGDIYASGSLGLFDDAEGLPIFGLYRVAGDDLGLSLADAASDADLAAGLTVDGATLFYFVQGVPGALRSVPLAGPLAGRVSTELASGFGRGGAIEVVDGRVYFEATSDFDELFGELHSVAVEGGSVTTAPLGSVAAFRTNDTLLAVSWNGDIVTSFLPEFTSVARVMRELELSLHDWWLDNQYLYWQQDDQYKRLGLDARLATEAEGELVQTLPAGAKVRATFDGEVIVTELEGATTRVYVMPQTGGELVPVGAVEGTLLEFLSLDENYVYLTSAFAVLRLER